jgi:hypothetical protein
MSETGSAPLEPGGFTVAVVTSHNPVEVSIQHLVLDIDPDDFFTTKDMPRLLEYPFDPTEAGCAIDDAGYEPTTGFQWTGTHWAAVIIPRDEAPPLPAGMLP